MSLFPGNSLLQTTKGVAVRATPTALVAVRGQVEEQVQAMRHGANAVERVVNAYYATDPVVQMLLALYLSTLDKAGIVADSHDSEALAPWPL